MADSRTYLIVGASAAAFILLCIIMYSVNMSKETYKSRYLPAPQSTPDMTQLGMKGNDYLRDYRNGITQNGDVINRFSLKNSESRPRKIKNAGVEAYAAPSYGLIYDM
jgi:hypothetical protein